MLHFSNIYKLLMFVINILTDREERPPFLLGVGGPGFL